MIGPHRVTVVIPALNEEKGVVATIERTPRSVDEILVIDGGSSDQTRINAEKLGAHVITQLIRGYGLAYKTGFRRWTAGSSISSPALGSR